MEAARCLFKERCNVPNTLNQARPKSFVGYMEARLVLTLHLFFQQHCKHPLMGVWFHLCRKLYVRTTSIHMQSVNCRWEAVWGCKALVRPLKGVKNILIIATEHLGWHLRTCRFHMVTTQTIWRWKHKSCWCSATQFCPKTKERTFYA